MTIELRYQGKNQTSFKLNNAMDVKETSTAFDAMALLQAVILFVIFVTGFFGNSLVLGVVFFYRHMRTRTNLFLTQLAVADIGICLFCIPFMVTFLIKQTWIPGESLCLFNGFITPFWLCSSIFTLTAISIHKYFSVVKPLKRITQRHTMTMVIAVWIASFVCSIGPVLGWTEIVYKSSSAVCGPRYPQNALEISHNVFLLFAAYTVPVVGMVSLYWRIIQSVKSHCRCIRKTAIIDDQGILAQKKIVVTLLYVLAAFVTCWTPFFAYGIATLAFDPRQLCRHFLRSAYTCGFLFSACYPVILVYRNPRFRRGFKELITFHGIRTQSPAGSSPQSLAEIRRPAEDYLAEKRCSVWFLSSQNSLLSLEPEPINRRRKLRWIETNL